MTCIVGLIDKETDKLYLGGDSCASIDNKIFSTKNNKIKKIDNFIIGGCGNSFAINLLYSSNLKFIKQKNNEDTFDYMINVFIKTIKDFYIKNNILCDYKINEDNILDCDFIVGYNKRFFHITENLNIFENKDDFISIGSGSAHAYGSLYTVKNMKLTPEEKILFALESAEYYVSNVRRPFNIISI